MAFCFSCYKEFDDEYDICPFCGKPAEGEPKEPIHLYPGTVLADRYIIGQAVGAGGFGVVYEAYDKKLETIVAVKEFFSTQIATRSAGIKELIINRKSIDEFTYRKERFLAEARYMAKFSNFNSIVNVYNYFEENNTAYLTMELLKGCNLSEYLRQHGEKISEDEITHIVLEVSKVLTAMHKQDIIHRDIAPDNIFMCDNGAIKLLDFGSAKLADAEEDVEDQIAKPGYTPPEQYTGKSEDIGPYTDVYALGATMYRCIVGFKPYESTDRKTEDNVTAPHTLDANVSENFSNIIMKAMALEEHMRFKDIPDMVKALNGEKKVISLEAERKLRKRRRFSGIAIALAILVLIGSLTLNSYEKKKSAETLEPAEIEVWFCIEDDSAIVSSGTSAGKSEEEVALNAVAEHFEGTFEGVDVVVRGFPESQYYEKLKSAAKLGELPNLFESTEASDEVLKSAQDLTNVIDSEQFNSEPFLWSCYSDAYPDKKQMPLGFIAPMACIITNGPVSLNYSALTFESLNDFGDGTKIAMDKDYLNLFSENFGSNTASLADKETFLKNENESAVLLTTSREIRRVQTAKKSSGYPIKFVGYSADEIYCQYTYEWSIGAGTKDEIRASERLLSWMLGNKYQTDLMIAWCADGQLPINTETFGEKCKKDSAYSSLEELENNFIFK